MLKRLLAFTCLLVLPLVAAGQTVALKTNFLHWGIGAPNLAVEVGVAKRVTLDLYGAWMPYSFSKEGPQWKHWVVQPEARIWTCEKFNGFYIGIHGLVGGFDGRAGNLADRIPLPAEANNYPEYKEKVLDIVRKQQFVANIYGGGVSLGYE